MRAPLIIAVGGRHPRPDAQNWCKRDRTAGYRRTVANSPRQRITAARGLRFTNTNTLCSRLCAIHLTGMPEAPDEPSLDFFPRSMYQCTANLIAPNTCQALNNVTHRALCTCVCFVSSFHQVQSCYQNYAHNSTLLHSLSLALALALQHPAGRLGSGWGDTFTDGWNMEVAGSAWFAVCLDRALRLLPEPALQKPLFCTGEPLKIVVVENLVGTSLCNQEVNSALNITLARALRRTTHRSYRRTPCRLPPPLACSSRTAPCHTSTAPAPSSR